MEERLYKYTEKVHPPVPTFKVGDICFSTSLWGAYEFSDVSPQKIRKVEVKWYDASDWYVAHWEIHYYIKGKMYDYSLKDEWFTGDESGQQIIYATQQDAMQDNIDDFLDFASKTVERMRITANRIGYENKELLDRLRGKLLEVK